MKSYPRIARIKAERKGEREKERERETRRSPIADVANDDAPRSGIDEEKPEIQVGRDRCERRSLEPAGNNLWMIFWRMRSSKGIDVNVESAIAVVALSLSLSLSLFP